ncbi:MAG: hypothetical protein ABSH51_18220 [Solirubrobacteraceae bacterium]
MPAAHDLDRRAGGAYVAALQPRVPWEDPIVLPRSDNLFIVRAPTASW